MRSILVLLGVALVLPLHARAAGQTISPSPHRGWGQQSYAGDLSPQSLEGAPSRFSIGGFVGYQDGLSFQAFGLARDFAQGLPLKARFRLARTTVGPGSAPDARRIFINDATNGTPKEAGVTWDFGLDGLYPKGDRTHFFGGVRYSRFKANFKYVGGNEDFDSDRTLSQASASGGGLRPFKARRPIQANAEPSRSRSPMMVGRKEMANPSTTTGGEISGARLMTLSAR